MNESDRIRFIQEKLKGRRRPFKFTDEEQDLLRVLKLADNNIEMLTPDSQKMFHEMMDKKIAPRIYEDGRFIKYAKTHFKNLWCGDLHILEGLLYLSASFRVQNVDEGIHLFITGQTQSGKSDSVKTGLKFISLEDQLSRTFSPMWVFYAAREKKDKKPVLHENTILFSDDTKFTEEVAGLYRNILTSWDTGVTRGSVDAGEAIDLTVPRHVSLVLTAVDTMTLNSIEGQDESRFLTLEIRRTPDQEKEIWEFVQREKQKDFNEYAAGVALLINQIWNVIPKKIVNLHKKIDKHGTIRESKRYLTLLKCHALLCNRDMTNDEDIDAVDKFLTYSKPMLDNSTPALLRNEAAVWTYLKEPVNIAPKGEPKNMQITWHSTDAIQRDCKMAPATVYRALRGNGTFDRPDGGLMAKIRNLEHTYDPDTRKWSFKCPVD